MTTRSSTRVNARVHLPPKADRGAGVEVGIGDAFRATPRRGGGGVQVNVYLSINDDLRVVKEI